MRGPLVFLTLVTVISAIGFLAAVAVAQPAAQTTAQISLRTTKLGMVLVNSSGRTLYLFAKDKNGKSACSGSCAKFWPPLLTHAKPTTGSGLKAALIGTTKRSNGSLQITYNKHPLYTFALDTKAGQTKGEGNLAFGARWYVVSAKGTAIKASTNTTTTSTTTTTSGTTTALYP
jgi:predicted lipoprotein with Yx(FWY)xxD motif